MSNVIKKERNIFRKGLVMDFSPENTSNEVLTHALNATLLTFNGNELSLQNDMGNGRVETAYLPEGYIPVGTCEYGGIIYIVSYNPLEDKSLIGCFPSPERNVSHDELGEFPEVLSSDIFQEIVNDNPTGKLTNTIQHVVLKRDKLNPGDKYIVCANDGIYNEKLVGLEMFDSQINDFKLVDSPILSLRVVSIEESGKIVDLNSTVRRYETTYNNIDYAYSILGTNDIDNTDQVKTDIDVYRNTLSSGYNVFKSKTSGRLAILAELIMIDSFSVTYSLENAVDSNNQPIQNTYSVTLHPEISTKECEEKYNIASPELKYYYLEESLGYLTINNGVNTLPGITISTYDNSPVALLFDANNYSSLQTINLTDLYDSLSLPPSIKNDTLGQHVQHLTFAKPSTYHDELLTNGAYHPISIGDITLPVVQGLNFPLYFKYQYKVVPCMQYGRLDLFAVSNVIDFSLLRNFSSSKINTWKYRVDGGQLRLTFGAVVNDLAEPKLKKVDGIVLEFYDVWGFAGSLTIENKKSYSGEFTKIIPLNTIDALSKNKVHLSRQTTLGHIGTVYDTFARNINITLNNTDGTFLYKNSAIGFDNVNGWTTSDKKGILSDCGTLYENLVYGVKVYFRRNDSALEKEYILADKFFLYTSSIFNDYYYTTQNYHTTLLDPKLDLALAYKLNDSSTLSMFNEDGIVNGYTPDSILLQYISGSILDSSKISGIKYCKYAGQTNLHLEIGLKEDYARMHLRLSEDLNNHFLCELQLYDNELNGVYEVGSDKELSLELILNYPSGLGSDWNKFGFSDGNNILKITTGFQDYNFTNGEKSYIPIKYQFVVGYKITVDNIKPTEVPVTTVCALCHIKDEGEYNYDDFNIYESESGSGNLLYLSNVVFYNTGTALKARFGVARLVDPIAATTLELCINTFYTEYDTIKLSQPGKLNSGLPLQELIPYIGKLTFCQPYLSGFSAEEGVNVSKGYIHPYIDEGTYGTAPNTWLYENPTYLLSLNTLKAINYQQEFLVTMNYQVDVVDGNTFVTKYNKTNCTYYKEKASAVKYSGFTGQQVAKFNKTLMNSMKEIYAYNPDYNTYKVNLGEVSVEDVGVKFTSNLLCSNASLNFPANKPTLNNFIAIGDMLFDLYLRNLQTYSGDIYPIVVESASNKWEPQVNLTANLYYCGGSDPVLISSLTYNTPAPNNLTSDLTFEDPSLILVRHANKSITQLRGDLDKNALYYFNNDTAQLIQLDVSNYTVANDGHISLLTLATCILKYKNIIWLNTNTVQPVGISTNSSIDILLKCRHYGYDGTSGLDLKTKGNKLILLNTLVDVDGRNPCFAINITGRQSKIQNYDISLRIWTYWINPAQMTYGGAEYNFSNLGFDNLWNIFTKGSGKLTYYGNLERNNVSINDIVNFTDLPVTVAIDNPESESYIGDGGHYDSPVQYNILLDGSDYKKIWFNPDLRYDLVDGYYYIIVIEITDVTVSSTHPIKYDTNQSIINVSRTSNYYKYNDDSPHSYTVLPEYQNALFKGSSITINDLIYVPNASGHRLYMRNGCHSHPDLGIPNAKSYPSAKLSYRSLTDEDSWKGGWYYHNRLWIDTGPSFNNTNI